MKLTSTFLRLIGNREIKLDELSYWKSSTLRSERCPELVEEMI